jgi:hypothetical protein
MQKIFSQELRLKDDTLTSHSEGSGNDFADWEEKKLGSYLSYKSKRNKHFKVDLVLSVSSRKGFISQSGLFWKCK